MTNHAAGRKTTDGQMRVVFSRCYYAIPRYWNIVWWPKYKMLRIYHWIIEVIR
jgi:hypothetical protein